MSGGRRFLSFTIVGAFVITALPVRAQIDTIRKNGSDSLVSKKKGIIRQLAQNLLTDTSKERLNELQRNDLPFEPYQDRIIRNITIRTLDFGVSLDDTTKRQNNRLTRLANHLHHNTRNYVIRDNLFFKKNQKLSSYLLGNTERHLRDLPFIQDARIIIQPVGDGADSVDIFILTKDVLSIGQVVELHNQKSAEFRLKEENLFGWGDRIQLQTFYDYDRVSPFGYGGEYIKRNIGGSFVDGSLGYLNFKKTFNGRPEESMSYLAFVRPLVNPAMLWTYALNLETHSTQNMYVSDSLYQSTLKYRYKIFDAWIGRNLVKENTSDINENQRLRTLIGLRMLNQKFSDRPISTTYAYTYTDVMAVLGAISIFKQNFYKTQYIYGFGRNEDVPEGIDASFTAGWTRENGRDRPYTAINFQRYFFNKKQDYFNYTFLAGSYFFNKKMEDVNLLSSIDYFSRLHKLNTKWKQRIFLKASFARQINSLLNQPLWQESQYGLSGFRNNYLGGDMRVTVKAESVFFSPWSVAYFKFAPFVFGNSSYFRLNPKESANTKLYTGVGGGIRTRNESLIFGTIELIGTYFPGKNMYNESWRVDINSNIRFKYNQEFIKRPDFVNVN